MSTQEGDPTPKEPKAQEGYKTTLIPQDLRDFFEGEEYLSEQTEEFKMELRSILCSLRKKIESHQLTCVIGDDKTARVPTLALGRTINSIYSSKGDEKIPVLFIDPHNYTGSRGGERGYGKEDKNRYDDLKAKVKLFFEKAGVTKGTMLLITDYIDTGSTIESFKEMSKEAGLEIVVVNETNWADREDDGLAEDSDPLSIHSKPLFITIKTPEDVQKQLDIFKEEDYLRKLTPLINDIKKTSYKDYDIKSFVLGLPFEQQKEFLSFLKKIKIELPRKEIDHITKYLTDWFNGKKNEAEEDKWHGM
jgi:hypothetical protein